MESHVPRELDTKMPQPTNALRSHQISAAQAGVPEKRCSRLLDRERDGAGDCIHWNRKAVHRRGDLVHRVRKVRLDEARRDDRQAQLIAASWRKPSEMARTANFVVE
jgi:hypothetical protein